jgi:hypothetical protein
LVGSTDPTCISHPQRRLLRLVYVSFVRSFHRQIVIVSWVPLVSLSLSLHRVCVRCAPSFEDIGTLFHVLGFGSLDGYTTHFLTGRDVDSTSKVSVPVGVNFSCGNTQGKLPIPGSIIVVGRNTFGSIGQFGKPTIISSFL